MIIKIESERLILKNYCENDLDNIHRLKANPLVWRFSSKEATQDINESKKYLTSILKSYADDKCDFQGLFLKDTKEYIGEAGILAFNKQNRRAVWGYNLLPKYWGNGYATEISRSVIKYLFEEKKVERIEALVMDGNEASRNVLEKSGFIMEGVLRNFTYIGNEYHNVYYYGIIRSDYYRC